MIPYFANGFRDSSQNFYDSESSTAPEKLFQRLASMDKNVESRGASLSSRSTIGGAKSAAACKSHSEAERKRRERINGHLATLRTLLPNTAKTDKASLLAEVIQHVKELKQHVSHVELEPVPGETDELTVSFSDDSSSLIKASLCCDDRPDLLSDLTHTLRALQLHAVKAEITTMGGRVKNVFLIKPSDLSDPSSLSSLRHALKAVIDKPALEEKLSSTTNKKPRLSHLQHHHHHSFEL